ncbi:ribokinase [Dactylosporangium sp. NPDC048998]|uniref:ribokinase n=1 Tax=Dactylosporangium sp. NPDC048998 TaxID=3363976 RepID=UPI0037146459
MTQGGIVFVGSINLDVTMRIDRFPEPGETVAGFDLAESGGGKSANQAHVSAKLGGAATLIVGVGADTTGTQLLDDAAHAGVDVSGCVTIPDEPTGRAFIERDQSGENRIVIIAGANGALRPDHVKAERFYGKDVACFALEVPLDTVRHGLLEAKRHDVITVLNPSPFAPEVVELLPWTDILIVNVHESEQLAALLGSDMNGLVLQHGISAVVVTAGVNGSTIYEGTRSKVVPTFAVDAVDTTGCGDAFTGAVATALAEGRSLSDAVGLGAAVGAYAAERVGAQPSYPTAAELDAWLTTARRRS